MTKRYTIWCVFRSAFGCCSYHYRCCSVATLHTPIHTIFPDVEHFILTHATYRSIKCPKHENFVKSMSKLVQYWGKYTNIEITRLKLETSIILLFAIKSCDLLWWISNMFWIVIITRDIHQVCFTVLWVWWSKHVKDVAIFDD